MSLRTEKQDDALREMSSRGAAYAAAEIERRCDVRHSMRAVKTRANRIRCSLAVQRVCPSCGAVGVKIQPTDGYVQPVRTKECRLSQERAFNEQLERKRAEAEDAAEIDDVRRERDGMRQRNSRLRRKYGLKGREKSEFVAQLSFLFVVWALL